MTGPFIVPAPYIRGYPQATSLEPTDAFVIDRQGVGTEYIEAGALTAVTAVNFAFEFLGAIPAINQVIGLLSFPVGVTFPANFSGSTGVIADPFGQNPTAPFVATIYKTGIGIGTMTISTGGVFTFTTPGPTVFPPNGNMTIIAPSSADATLINFAWTLAGALT